MFICSFSKQDRSQKMQTYWAISWNQKEGGGDGAMAQDTLRVKSWMTMKELIWHP